MPKFSIIVPVYNVEEYIEKCLTSIQDQTYKDYEVIVVNDGTKDNSMELVKKYPFKVINQKNQGLSAARNRGVKEATGDYILFLDSDDYLEKETLSELNKSLKNNPDVVRFQIQEVYSENKIIKYPEVGFSAKSGEEAFTLITKYHFVENAWCYAIRKEYYDNEHFAFKEGMIHEDFGLLPLIIIKAKKVNSISYIGYNYVQREGSIMNAGNYEKTKKKVADFLKHYQYLLTEINKTSLDATYFKSFISNSLILKITELNKKDYKEYKKKLVQENVFDNLLVDTTSRKIKRKLLQASPRLYHKIKLK